MWLQHLRCQLWIRTPLNSEVFLILKSPCVWGVLWATQIKQLGFPNAWQPVRAHWRAQCLLLQRQGGPCARFTVLNRAGRHLDVAAAGHSWSTASKTLQAPRLCTNPRIKTFLFLFFFCVLLTVLDFASESRIGLYQTWGICCSNTSVLCSSQPELSLQSCDRGWGTWSCSAPALTCPQQLLTLLRCLPPRRKDTEEPDLHWSRDPELAFFLPTFTSRGLCGASNTTH